MTLSATPEEQSVGMAFQSGILEVLKEDSRKLNHDGPNSYWAESRQLLLRDMFHSRKEEELSREELNKLNYEESVRGDLIDYVRGISLECQTAVTKRDCGWEHSKRVRCKAKWQCFGFKSGARLVIQTESLRMYLNLWKVEPTPSKRSGNAGYYNFSEEFLRDLGATDIDAWLENLKHNPHEL